MKQILNNYFILFFMLFTTSLQGQGWTRLYSDTATNTFTRIVKTIPYKDGYAFVGMTVGNSSNIVFLVGHTQSDGQVKWQKRIEESVALETFFITADVHNELALVNVRNLDNLKYTLDFIKLTSTGQVKINKIVNSIDTVNKTNVFKVSQFMVVEDSNYLVSLTGKNPKLLKLNALGDTLWTRQYSDITSNLTHDGHIIALNVITSEIAKLNVKTGDIIWKKKLDPSNLIVSEYSRFSFFNTSDKGIVYSGKNVVTDYGEEEMKFDENGSYLWRVPALSRVAFASAPTKDGGFVKIYQVYPAVPIEHKIAKYDKNGFIQWDELLFTNSSLSVRTRISNIFQTHDDGYLISGSYDEIIALKGRLIKTDANGNMVTPLKEQVSPHFKINVAPNPFSELTTIEIENLSFPILGKNCRFKLFDATGKLLKTNDFKDSKLTIARDNLPNGFYFFIIENDAKVIGIGKIRAY